MPASGPCNLEICKGDGDLFSIEGDKSWKCVVGESFYLFQTYFAYIRQKHFYVLIILVKLIDKGTVRRGRKAFAINTLI